MAKFIIWQDVAFTSQ